MKRVFVFGTVAAVVALAACGGGGGSSGVPVARASAAPGAQPASGKAAPASFTIRIPGSGSSSLSRRAKAVSAATQSLVFTLLKTDSTDPAFTTTPNASTPFNVGLGSSLCTAPDTSGARSCTIGISAPIGNDIYTVDAFSTTNAASGSKLGTAAVSVRVAQNATNAASISLGGQIASLLLTTVTSIFAEIGPPGNAFSSPQSERIYVLGLDAQGNAILAPDTFSTPISLALTTNGVQILCDCNFLDPVPSVQLAVTYANPGTGPASAQINNASTLPIIQVTSPNDIVTVSAIAPGSALSASIAITGVVGVTTTPTGVQQASAAIDVAFDSGPQPAATPVLWTLFCCGNQSLQFTFAVGTTPATYSFSSPQDIGALLGVSDTNVAATMVTFTSTCPGSGFTKATSFPVTLALGEGQVQFLLQPSTANPPASIVCTITATDNAGSPAQSITINVANVSGIIQ
jgi:hypothetical protein